MISKTTANVGDVVALAYAAAEKSKGAGEDDRSSTAWEVDASPDRSPLAGEITQ